VLEMLNYIRNPSQTQIDKNFSNGVLDEGRKDVSLDYFLHHERATKAHLVEAEVNIAPFLHNCIRAFCRTNFPYARRSNPYFLTGGWTSGLQHMVVQVNE
jgi:hypothetical protein